MAPPTPPTTPPTIAPVCDFSGLCGVFVGAVVLENEAEVDVEVEADVDVEEALLPEAVDVLAIPKRLSALMLFLATAKKDNSPCPVLIIDSNTWPSLNAYPGSAQPSVPCSSYPVNPISQQKKPPF